MILTFQPSVPATPRASSSCYQPGFSTNPAFRGCAFRGEVASPLFSALRFEHPPGAGEGVAISLEQLDAECARFLASQTGAHFTPTLADTAVLVSCATTVDRAVRKVAAVTNAALLLGYTHMLVTGSADWMA